MINIRREQPADYAAIYELVKQAFEHAEHTDHDEHNLVNRLRQSPFIFLNWRWSPKPAE